MRNHANIGIRKRTQIMLKNYSDFRKKRNEYLLLMFVCGVGIGIIDGDQFNTGYLFGNGLGTILLSMGIGYLINLFTNKGDNKESDENLLDENLETSEAESVHQKILTKLQPFRFGSYVAGGFLLLAVLQLVIALLLH